MTGAGVHLSRINIANRLTLLRIALVPVFIAFLMFETYWGYLCGLLVFIAAAVTDHYDGKLARERGLITDFGKFLDPLADKVLVGAAFIYFIGTTPSVPAWVVILIIAREFAVSGLRTLAASKGRVIAADNSGKLKTVCQMTYIITFLVLMSGRKLLVAFTDVWAARYDGWLQGLSHVLIGVTVVVTIYSGYRYLRNNRDILLEGVAPTAG